MGKRRRKLLIKVASAIDDRMSEERNALIHAIAPVPDLLKGERIVFVGPHPDDIEIGAGATVARMLREGKKIKYIICTDGGSGSSDFTMTAEKIVATRAAETANAAKVMGDIEVVNLGFPDGGIYDENELAKAIGKEIYEFEADTVFCPDPHLPTETHPDHLACARAVSTALFIAGHYFVAKRRGIDLDPARIPKGGKVLAYYYTHRANTAIEVTQQDIDLREQAISAHVSQFIPIERDGICLYLALRSKDMGKMAGVPLAEGFFAMAPMHQHCVTEL